MNKFDEALEIILNEHEIEQTAGGYTHCIEGFTPSQTEAIRLALTQAAEIERGDKVVVDREPPSYSELLHKLNRLVEDFKSITASKGK